MNSAGESGIDICWLPAGAVRLNGRVFEWLTVKRAHRRPVGL
jgi:hypothetical protein